MRASDEAVERLEAVGHPVARLELSDRYALGAEFFRWEYATAIAGSMLDVHPFDQPDVQGAKDNTDVLLDAFLRQGHLPERAAHRDPCRPYWSRPVEGDYLAIMSYFPPDPAADALLDELRSRIMERCHIATTAGYGPRYLHSTGQLHKGGPGSGLYLQLTLAHYQELPIPGQQYSFDVLAAAQAIGDYQALANLGRRLVAVNLGDDAISGLRRLLDEL